MVPYINAPINKTKIIIQLHCNKASSIWIHYCYIALFDPLDRASRGHVKEAVLRPSLPNICHRCSNQQQSKRKRKRGNARQVYRAYRAPLGCSNVATCAHVSPVGALPYHLWMRWRRRYHPDSFSLVRQVRK